MKQTVRTLYLFPLLALALVVVGMLLPTATEAAASPKIHQLSIRHQNLISTRSNYSSNNVTYHGGPEMVRTSADFAIFWEPTGSYVSSTYNSLILRYFGDVGGSALYHNNTQYHDRSGNYPDYSVLGGSWVDTAAYPSGTLSDAQIQAEVTHAQAVRGWRWTSDYDKIFFVFTAKGENICNGSDCSFVNFCAYHSFFGTSTQYAAMPYTGTALSGCGVPYSPNNDIDADSTINTTSHEQMEAATDPHSNAWSDVWTDEIGDKCQGNYNGGNVTWNGHKYLVQEEWDNATSGCVLAGP